MLLPTKNDDGGVKLRAPSLGVFITAFVSFFFAELADKTQLATMALSARYNTYYWAVVLGSVCGMMAVNIPAVFFGEKAAKILPMRVVHIGAALIYGLTGLVTLLSHSTSLPISPAS
jgi:putative Ca2+/H+ antiporter (TMEM165/GDT1 family)